MIGRRWTRGTAKWGLLFAGLLVAGCESSTDSDSSLDEGSFEVDIVGGPGGSSSGFAFHGTDEESEGDLWLVAMITAEEVENLFVFVGRYGTRPATGEYDLVDANAEEPGAGDWVGGILAVNDETVTFFGLSTSGSVEITFSSANRVAGTFDFDAVGYDPEDPETEIFVSVSGAFNAAAGDVFIPECAECE